MKNTLLISFSKYLKSEGIFHTQMLDSTSYKCVPVIIACISGKFVAFDPYSSLPEVAQTRILRNGGVIYYPTTLDDFVTAVRRCEK